MEALFGGDISGGKRGKRSTKRSGKRSGKRSPNTYQKFVGKYIKAHHAKGKSPSKVRAIFKAAVKAWNRS